MKQFALFALSIFLLAGCGTTKSYTPSMEAGPPKPPDYPIPVYNIHMRLPRPCELIGHLAIGDTQLTMFGGTMLGVMKTIMQTAHEKGADVVVLTSIKSPEFESAHYRVEADLLRYADAWETVHLSEKEFVKYLQTHRQTLDPIEGIWTDGSADHIGIIRDTTKPGRDFIGFMLNASLPSWQPGYKKIALARTERPDAYSLKYYRDDFAMVKTTLLLEHDRVFNFMVTTDDKAEEVTFTKVGTPLPLN